MKISARNILTGKVKAIKKRPDQFGHHAGNRVGSRSRLQHHQRFRRVAQAQERPDRLRHHQGVERAGGRGLEANTATDKPGAAVTAPLIYFWQTNGGTRREASYSPALIRLPSKGQAEELAFVHTVQPKLKTSNT
jgi:hypothetical protein